MKTNLALIIMAFALSACVLSETDTNPYYAAGAGRYITSSMPDAHDAGTSSGSIHAIAEGELHW